VAAAQAVSLAIPQISAAAALVAETLKSGRTITYAAAGSSGLMALSDASELPGTFRIPAAQIRIAMAGGVPVDGHMPGNTEDATDTAAELVAMFQPGDIAIVISASGTTPYACAVAKDARAKGNKVIGIANVAGSELLTLADIAIAVPTAMEVIEGSTRLGAGTAQKIALNMVSTMAGVLLGHVHQGLMVNLNPDNIKLRKRATEIIRRIANVTEAKALRALETAQNEPKLAVLIATGASAEQAADLLARHDQRLGPCLAEIAGPTSNND
jgi:N-acetylmuramic acid 6-phosphate etherase